MNYMICVNAGGAAQAKSQFAAEADPVPEDDRAAVIQLVNRAIEHFVVPDGPVSLTVHGEANDANAFSLNIGITRQ